MTVSELIKELTAQEGDRIVILASDSEGNSHSPLSSFWTGSYKPTATWCGEVGFEKLTEELRKEGYAEEDVIKGQKALILYPIN